MLATRRGADCFHQPVRFGRASEGRAKSIAQSSVEIDRRAYLVGRIRQFSKEGPERKRPAGGFGFDLLCATYKLFGYHFLGTATRVGAALKRAPQ